MLFSNKLIKESTEREKWVTLNFVRNCGCCICWNYYFVDDTAAIAVSITFFFSLLGLLCSCHLWIINFVYVYVKLLTLCVYGKWLAGELRWTVLSSDISSADETRNNLIFCDFRPATWYQLKVSATNDAGKTTAHYNIATTKLNGGN